MEQARDRGCKPTACHSVDETLCLSSQCRVRWPTSQTHAQHVGMRDGLFASITHVETRRVRARTSARAQPSMWANAQESTRTHPIGACNENAWLDIDWLICDRERQQKKSAFDAPCPPSSSEAVAASSQATPPLRLSLSRPHPSLARIQGSCGHRRGEHNRVARGGLCVDFGKACSADIKCRGLELAQENSAHHEPLRHEASA
jgi:hypothetical protein